MDDLGYLGFVAFAGFRAHAEYDNAQRVWEELPEEIRAQWRAAADAVEQACAYGPDSKHAWPLPDACLFGPWQLHTGMPTPRQYRTCVHPRCTEVEYRAAAT